MDHRFRENLIELMNQKGIDAMMIAPSQELRFLAGFTVYLDERFQAMVLTAKGEAFYICNLLSRDEVAEQTQLPMEIYTWTDNENFTEKARDILEKYGLLGGTIGVNTTVPAYHSLLLAQKTGVHFVDGTKWLEEIRIIKTAEEREKLRIASKITDEIFPDILSFIRPGIREIDIRTRMEQLFAERGVKLAGDIVASGSNSALPHYFGNQRIIGEQDVIVLDYGCNYQGIFSDMTRTVFVGGISSEQEKVYHIVEQANRAAREKAVLGAYIPDIDQAARGLIEKEGYGAYFTCRLGHGIGYITHEQPEIKAVNRRNLEEGMAFSIEPGIYMAGKFGIRIEDIILMEKDGPECLNHTSRDIIVL